MDGKCGLVQLLKHEDESAAGPSHNPGRPLAN